MANEKKSIRDPEGRKQAITRAAADLVLEFGPNAVTHRKIAERAGVPLGSTTQHFANLDELLAAAYALLDVELAQEVQDLTGEIRQADDFARTVASLLHGYLSDPEKVRLDTVFFVVNAQHPSIRRLNVSWNDRLVAELSNHTDRVGAHAIATYMDGLTMGVIQTGELPPEVDIEVAIRRLLGEDKTQ